MNGQSRVPLPSLLAVIALVGLTSLGGRVACYHDVLVEKRPWLTDQEFLAGSALSNFVPGPIFVNFTVYAAQRLGGWAAVPLAVALCVIPGAVLMLALSAGYTGGLSRTPVLFAGLSGLTGAGTAFSATLAFLGLGPLQLSLLVVVPPLALAGLWFNRPQGAAR